MNVGVIVFSATGNTLSVAQEIKDSLMDKGHTVTLERVTTLNENPHSEGGKQLKNTPKTDPYDMLIFGAPVWGFTLCSVMKSYFSQLERLDGKKVGCFVTQQLPYAWMGGNRSISEMKTMCENKGASVYNTGIINWSSKKKMQQIKEMVKNMTV